MADQEYLNERVRDTVIDLSDEELTTMLGQPGRYTGFALDLARKELARRRRSKGRQKRVTAKDEKAERIQGRSGDCWIQVWREPNFKGESFRIYGPSEYPSLRFGTDDWGDQIGSLRVGPHAFVLAYRDKNFKASMVSFGPNQEVENLSEFKLDDEIDSIRIIDSMKIFDRPPLK